MIFKKYNGLPKFDVINWWGSCLMTVRFPQILFIMILKLPCKVYHNKGIKKCLTKKRFDKFISYVENKNDFKIILTRILYGNLFCAEMGEVYLVLLVTSELR